MVTLTNYFLKDTYVILPRQGKDGDSPVNNLYVYKQLMLVPA